MRDRSEKGHAGMKRCVVASASADKEPVRWNCLAPGGTIFFDLSGRYSVALAWTQEWGHMRPGSYGFWIQTSLQREISQLENGECEALQTFVFEKKKWKSRED